MTSSEVVIVGAGPAGSAAALVAAEHGLDVTLVDEHPAPGGQIYRAAVIPGLHPTAETHRGDLLREQLARESDRVRILSGHVAWGVFGGRRLAVTGPDGWQLIEAGQLVLAPGAYEYVPPFPGWTLPGVMTPGAAQLLVKSQGVVPAGRVLVAGTGPFLLVVALGLHEAGVEVVGVCEAVRRRDVLWKLPGLFADLGMLRQGREYLGRLKRAGIPLWTGRLVTAAVGDLQLQQVELAACNGGWIPDRARRQTLDVDMLCVGYGFVPRTGLAQLAGCELAYRDEIGGWVPRVDEWGGTSVEGVWSAGDGAGVAGAIVAELEGQLAGLGLAHRAGAIDLARRDSLAAPLHRRAARLARFRRALDRLSRVRPGLSELAGDETVVCRCEELLRREIDEAVAAGNRTLRSLKVATRVGMGPCQGAMCWPALARDLTTRHAIDATESGPLSVRPPLVPVTLGTLAEPAGGDGAGA